MIKTTWFYFTCMMMHHEARFTIQCFHLFLILWIWRLGDFFTIKINKYNYKCSKKQKKFNFFYHQVTKVCPKKTLLLLPKEKPYFGIVTPNNICYLKRNVQHKILHLIINLSTFGSNFFLVLDENISFKRANGHLQQR